MSANGSDKAPIYSTPLAQDHTSALPC